MKKFLAIAIILGAVAFTSTSTTRAHNGWIEGPRNSGIVLNIGQGYNYKVGYTYSTGSYNQSDWATVHNLARLSWQNANTAINFYDGGAGVDDINTQVRVHYSSTGCYTPYNICTSAAGEAFYVKFQSGVPTLVSSSSNYNQVFIIIKVNANQFSQYGTGSCSGLSEPTRTNCWFDKQAVVAHEMGHAHGLAHLPSGNPVACGDANYYQSLMDYDCYRVPTGFRLVNGPTNMDVCGVNHKYWASFPGYAGCGQP